MSLFKYPSPVLLSSSGGGGGGSAIVNSSSAVSVNIDQTTGSGNVQITTNNTLALTVDRNQNVVIGSAPMLPSGKLTVSAAFGQCVQLINTSALNASSSFIVNSNGGLAITTTGSEIQLGSNKVYVGTGSLYIGNTAITSTAEQLNYISSTPGIATPLKALVVDSSLNISNINSLSAETLRGTLRTGFQPNITSLYSVNINSLSLGGVKVLSTSNEINYLHGITPGIAMASSAAILDANCNLTELNSLQATSITGTIQTASQPNITSIGRLTTLLVSSKIGIGTTIPSRTLDILSATPSIRLSNGTYNAEVSIDMNGNFRLNPDQEIVISSHTDMLFSGTSAITGLDTLSANTLFGAIQTSSQPNITSIGTLSVLNVNGDVIFGSLTNQSKSQRITINEPNGQCISLVRSTSLGCTLTINTYGDLELNPTRNIKILSGSSLTMAGQITGVSDLVANTLTGIIQTSSQPNITSIGTLLNLTVANDISAASISASTLIGTIQTTSQPNITSIGTLSNLNVTNGIAATSIIASSLTGIIQTSYQPNITTIGTLSSLSVVNGITTLSLSASTVSGVIQTAAQPNITSIGTLSSLSVSNGITSASLIASTLTGTIQTASQPNITTIGTLSNLTVSNAITASSISASTLTGLIQTAAQPNITSLGTLSSLNVVNTISASSVAASTITGTLQTSSQPNITSIGVLNHLSTTGRIGIGVDIPACAIDINTSALSFDPSISFNNGTISGSIGLTSTGININTTGPYLTLGTGVSLKFVGGGLIGLSSLTATTLTGTLQTSAQPNITSIGTLATLNTGYIGVGTAPNNQYRLNILDSNGKIAMISDGSNSLIISVINNNYTINTSTDNIALGPDVNLLLNGGTIIGLDNLIANTITGIIATPSQPNITSLGTLSSLSVSGEINAANASISGSATISGNLTVGGSLTLSTPLSFSNLSSSTGSFNANIEASSSTNGGTLTIIGGASFSQNVIIGTSLNVGGSVLTSSIISSISTSTPGTATAGVFLMTDSNKDLSGFNSLTTTFLNGTLKTEYQPNITTIGNLTNLNINGYLGVGTASPIKQMEINSSTGDCLRLSYNKGVNTGYMDIFVNASGNATLLPSGGTLTISSNVIAQRIILGNTTNATMPLEIGYVPFVMTQAYGYNTNLNAHGVMPAGGTTSYNYSIRATGRILCTQSVDVMSDRRTKKNIQELSDEFCSSFIERTNPVSFNWIDGDDNKSFGYIAQDLIREGFPDLVNFTHDDNVEEEIDEDGFIHPAGVKFTVTYQHIIPILAKNQKRLMKENAELKAKLDSILAMLQKH